MKPIKLVLSAYGPFPGKTVIDFDKLGSDGVFLISGPTGSGKTTIFDGICYALYGTASGNLRTAKMMRSTYADPDIKTFVELTFLSHGLEYRINRRPEQEITKINGKGTTVRQSEVFLEILDDGNMVYTGKREVEDKIKEIIGLDANQFRQVTMIAQGEFLKVLNSSTEERMAIFSKVFKTGRYTWLQDELKLAVKEVSINIAEIESNLKREYNHVLTQEFLEREGISINQDSLLYTQKKEILEKAYQITKEDEQEIASLKAKLMNDKERLIKDSANLESIISHFSKLLDITKRMEVLEAQKESIIQNQNSIPTIKKNIEKIISKISRLDSLKPRYKKLETDRDKISKQCSDLRIQEEELSELSNKCEKIKQALVLDKKRLSELEEEFSNSDEINAQLNLRLNFQASLLKSSDIIGKIEDLNLKLDDFSKKIKENQIAYINLKEEYNNMEVHYLKQQAGILARDLEYGEPCPVCGSTSHPKLAEFSNILYDKEDLKTKKKELEIAEETLSNTKQKASLIKGNKDTLEEEFFISIDLLKKDYENQNYSFKTLVENFVVDSFEMSREKFLSVDDIVQKDIKKLKTKLSKILESKEKYTSLKTNIDDLEKELQEFTQENNRRMEEYNKLSGEYKASKALYDSEVKELEYENIEKLNAKISECQYLLDYKREEIADMEEKIENYYLEYNTLKSSKETLLSLLDGKDEVEVREAYEKHNLEIDDLKQRINSVETEQTGVISLLKNISSALDVYENYLPVLEDKKNLYDQYSNLSATCNGELPGKAKIKLESFVQMSFLDRILNRANIRLLKMSEGRYMLSRDDEGENKRSQTGLDLRVHDLSNNTYRSTKSLSGGESFQASLCLALGFADEIQHSAGGIQIETMFIDEGFGTLDSVALKNAVDSLVDLSKGNKLVGIISHVDELRERIDKGINIEKSSLNGSKLTIQA